MTKSLSQKSGEFLALAFRFFASLRLAIFLLVSLMAVLATGTILESLHGTDAARITVYESPWFSLLLLLLGINVAAAALDRLPWQKKHTGFVITHLGIITILIGSFLTQKSMVDGQMSIAEGKTEQSITLSKPLLYIFQEDSHQDWLFELKEKAFAWNGKKTLLRVSESKDAKPFQIHLRSYYPKALMEETMMSTQEGSPALKVKIHNSFVDESVWLWRDDKKMGETQMGPAKVVFSSQKLQEAQGAESNLGYLELELDGSTHRIPVPENKSFPQTISVEGTDAKVEILNFYRNAAVVGTKLVEQDLKTKGQVQEPVPLLGNNPALRLFLRAKGKEELHTVFAKFPDFSTMHGMKPSELGSHLYYRLPGSGSKGQSHELRFVETPEGLTYQVQTGLRVETHPVKTGEETALGWMDLHFKVEQFYPHARLEKKFTPQDSNAQGDSILTAIELEIEQSGKSKLIWLGQGIREAAEFGDSHYLFMFGEKRLPAGFSLMLRDFRMETYPGTNDPASFESDVTLRDDLRGVVKEAKISMNEPLVYRGYKVYQSGYSLENGAPEVSIFSVGRDPGIPLKYAGTIIMVIGIILMFYFRSYSRNGGNL